MTTRLVRRMKRVPMGLEEWLNWERMEGIPKPPYRCETCGRGYLDVYVPICIDNRCVAGNVRPSAEVENPE